MNAKEHGCLGAVAGAGYTFIKYLWRKSNDPDASFPWDQLVFNMILGFALASLPDWIEPATNPNHRKFFHSFAMGGLVVYGMYGKHTENMRLIGMSYLSHLAADARTPKSIPLIHPKII